MPAAPRTGPEKYFPGPMPAAPRTGPEKIFPRAGDKTHPWPVFYVKGPFRTKRREGQDPCRKKNTAPPCSATGDMVWRVALNACRQTQDAEDVVQDVFLKL